MKIVLDGNKDSLSLPALYPADYVAHNTGVYRPADTFGTPTSDSIIVTTCSSDNEFLSLLFTTRGVVVFNPDCWIGCSFVEDKVIEQLTLKVRR